MALKIKNWNQFQHFKDRRPPWIKLYRELLDDFEWFKLSGDDAKSLIMLWLIASEHGGNLPPIKDIAWRLRISEAKAEELIESLSHWLEPGQIEPNDWASRYISKEIKAAVFERDGGNCQHCGTSENIEYDHIIPVSGGGTGDEQNIQLLCRSCNRKKRNKTSAESRLGMCVANPAHDAQTETETETETEKKNIINPDIQVESFPVIQEDIDNWIQEYQLVDIRARLRGMNEWLKEEFEDSTKRREVFVKHLAKQQREAEERKAKEPPPPLWQRDAYKQDEERDRKNRERLKTIAGGLQ